jgi:hypothetical protein
MQFNKVILLVESQDVKFRLFLNIINKYLYIVFCNRGSIKDYNFLENTLDFSVFFE